MSRIVRPLAAGAAALTMAMALAPTAAEARWSRGGALAAGLIGGALIGTALAANAGSYGPAYAPVAAGPDCYRVRERVWDDYRGRFVTIRRTVCE